MDGTLLQNPTQSINSSNTHLAINIPTCSVNSYIDEIGLRELLEQENKKPDNKIMLNNQSGIIKYIFWLPSNIFNLCRKHNKN